MRELSLSTFSRNYANPLETAVCCPFLVYELFEEIGQQKQMIVRTAIDDKRERRVRVDDAACRLENRFNNLGNSTI